MQTTFMIRAALALLLCLACASALVQGSPPEPYVSVVAKPAAIAHPPQTCAWVAGIEGDVAIAIR